MKRDPITGREISDLCWDGVHQKTNAAFVFDHYGCRVFDCGCLCHPRNQVEPVPVVPGFEDPCGNCLGLREVVSIHSGSTLLGFIPCPKCCSAVNSEKENV
jgi:hypothetical protein